MEDALAHIQNIRETDNIVVLILVVMEDALALTAQVINGFEFKSLNPCCNGRCTRTAIARFGIIIKHAS